MEDRMTQVRDEAVGLSDALRRICAWCGIELAPGVESAAVTHGMCALCEAHADVAQPFTDPTTRRKVSLVPVHSSNLAAAGWYVEGTSGVAIVRFAGGATYRYTQVPRGWWISFLAAESKGRHFAMTLKAEPTRFPCTRITEQADEGQNASHSHHGRS